MSTPPVGTPEALQLARYSALVRLGTAVRELTHAVVDTEVDDPVLARAAALAQEATELLTAVTRPLNRFSSVEPHVPGRPGRRLFSPVVGAGNPVSPPLTIVASDAAALRVEAVGTLHRVHEGPPTYGHGGMSAMLLDQILGQAVMLTGRVGLTRSLDVRYRRPVPLGIPLALTASVTHRDDSRMEASGQIAIQARPEVVLVEAVGTFLQPRPDQVDRLFGHVERSDAAPLPTGD